jgi:hypothetical protein
MGLAPGQRWRTRHAGAFLFLPLLAAADFGGVVAAAGYPGSAQVPARSALLSLLLLKLLGKERLRHADDFNFEPALGLFAGLNVLPKKSFATAYSYRCSRPNQQALLSGWVKALAGVLSPDGWGRELSLDFHAIPYRGDPATLENHHIPLAGRASPAVLSFFALEQESRVLCYSNANLVRAEQAGEVMRFVEFWHALAGSDPSWLYFDSKVTTYEELSRLAARGIRFVTIRRRGAAVVRRLRRLPASAWTRAVIDTPKRFHQDIRYVDERVTLRGYAGQMARNLVIRYAGRNRVEDGLGIAVDFFHLDRLSSEVRLNVDLDCALTVVANGCYRWLGGRLKGCGKAKPKALFRRFVDTPGLVEAHEGHVEVRLDRRSHNPVLREAELDRDGTPVPWLGGRTVRITFA